MNILKVGDGPFIGSNGEIVRQLFGRTVGQDNHSVFNIEENKCVSFMYFSIQQPNGEWRLPPRAPVTSWLNKPNKDNSEFTRVCYEENLNRLYTDSTVEYAVFSKTSRNESYFYGVFKFIEQEENYTKCVYKRVSTELNCEDWK